MNLRFVSLDIETTGLDPSWCQVLSLGAVDSQTDATFYEIVAWDEYQGQDKALEMNDALLHHPDARPIIEVVDAFRVWLIEQGYNPAGGWTCAGQNAASFDWQFLRPHCTPEGVYPHFRFLDPGPIYARPGDRKPPGLAECARRAGLPVEAYVWHNALDDARAVRDVLLIHFMSLEHDGVV